MLKDWCSHHGKEAPVVQPPRAVLNILNEKKSVPFVFPEEFGKKLEKEPRLCFAQQSWFSRLPIFWQFQRK